MYLKGIAFLSVIVVSGLVFDRSGFGTSFISYKNNPISIIGVDQNGPHVDFTNFQLRH